MARDCSEYGNNKTERAILENIGAKVHKNSGRGMIKGDGTWHNFTVDVKECAASYTLNQVNWAKICTDAVSNHADPMLLLVMGRNDSRKRRLAVIEYEVLEQLLEERGKTW